MTATVREKATAVYKTFRSLKPDEREGVVELLLHDRHFREDLLDVATIESRRHEPARPLRSCLTARKKK